MYKQIIIARKDLKISPAKLSAQVSHASMAFLTNQMRRHCEIPDKCDFMPDGRQYKNHGYVKCSIFVTEECYNQWIQESFTKIVLQARNKNHLLKAKTMAEELGMKEGEDFFLIKDECRTELEPEEFDENGIGRTLTCIGFAPMDSEVIDKIGKKYHLYV